MIHTIKNAHLQVSIKQIGAELCSLKKLNDSKEYIWQANPEIWENHAPVLFPIIGSLKEGKYTYKDKVYSLPKHGLIRNNPNLKVEDKTNDSITFSLKSTADTLKQYPFDFEFQISYKLIGSKLSISHKVINNGDHKMYFSVGGHPAFNCPINQNNSLEDYYIEFEHNENVPHWLINADGLGIDESKECLKNANVLQLNDHIFNNDAVIIKEHKSNFVTLNNRNTGKILKFSYADFNYLGIWSKPKAPYVCIEPWLGITDYVNHNQDITQKEGILNIESGKEFEAEFSVEL